MKFTSIASFSALAACLVPALAVPVMNHTLAQQATNSTQDADWVEASIVSVDFSNADTGITELSSNETHSDLVSRDTSKTSLSGLAGCLHKKVPGWPKKRPGKDDFDTCYKQNIGSLVTRGQPDQITAAAPTAYGDRLSGVCSTANTVLSNFIGAKDMSTISEKVCDKFVSMGSALVTKDAGALTTSVSIQGGHKKDNFIQHKGKNVSIIGTVANLAGINVKDKLVDLCVQAVKYQAETCLTDLKYGMFNAETKHVVKPSTLTWRDAKGASQAVFDIAFAMPGAF